MLQNKRKYTLLPLAIAVCLLCALRAGAQVDAQLTQYWAVPAYYNPGATGTTDFIHISAGSRLQWLGIKHAPMTFMGLADMPFKFLERRWGAGVVVQSESVGLFRTLNVGVQGSYKKKMLHGTLSVGFQAGLVNQTFRGDSIFIPENDDYHTGNDDAIPRTNVTGNSFDMSAGVFFTHKWFWVGASVTHLTSPTVTLKAGDNEQDRYEFDTGRYYYFMAGSNIPIKNTLFELQPSIMVKTDMKFWQAEATARVRYKKFLSGGVAYRHKDAVSLMLGAEFKNCFIGYSYDYAISAINKASSGSHELFFSYNLKLDMGERNKNKHKSIRIM